MRLEQLFYYVNVCHLGSINRASKALHIAQQSLSTSIQNLEDEIGEKLLERTKKGVTPTAIGEEFYKFALETVVNWQNFQRDFLNKNTQLKGTVHILTLNAYMNNVLPRLCIYFMQHFPNIEIKSSTSFNKSILRAVNNNEADIGLSLIMSQDYTPSKDLFANTEFIKLHDIQLYCLMSKMHPLAKSSEITLQQLKKENIAWLKENDNYLFDKFLPNYYAKAPKENICDTIYMLKEIVQANIAVCVDLRFPDNNFCLANFFDKSKITAIKVKNISHDKQISWGYLVNKNFIESPLFTPFEEFFNLYTKSH